MLIRKGQYCHGFGVWVYVQLYVFGNIPVRNNILRYVLCIGNVSIPIIFKVQITSAIV